MTDVPELLFAHHAWLRRLAHDLVRSEHADDIVQETLRIAIERPPAQAGALRAWLGRVLHNVAQRVHRSEARRRMHEHTHAGIADRIAPAPDEILGRQQLAVTIAEAVRDLDEPYRTTIHLRYYENLPPSAIAARTATSVATVKTRLLRAREQLRRALDRRADSSRWHAALFALNTNATLPPLLAMTATAKLALVAAVAVLALLPFVFRKNDTASEPPAPTNVERVATTSTLPPPTRTEVPLQEAKPRGIRGKAVLANGDGVPGARFRAFVGPHPDGDKNRWPRTEPLTTATDGTFQLAADDGLDAMLRLEDARWELAGAKTTRVNAVAPAELRIELQAVPHARLLVRAHDVTTGQPLQNFACRFHTPADDSDWPEPGRGFRGGFAGAETTTGEIEHVVAVRGVAARVQVDLSRPGQARERLTLRAGETRAVQLAMQSGERIRGVVVDMSGNPIAGATVFAGTQVRARGDEPGKPFLIDRIKDGATTDAHGAFEIAAAGAFLSAWHREYSPKTVRIVDARRIELGPLAMIRGRLFDAAGEPRGATELRLDRTRTATTTASGAFEFANVETGARLLYVPGPRPTRLTPTNGGPWVAHARAGEVVDAVLAGGLPELRLELSGHGDAKALAIVGLSTGTSLAGTDVADSVATLPNIVPGDYQLITDAGALLRIAVTGPRLTVALGQGAAACALVIATDDKSAFHVTPADADDMVRTMIGRVVRRKCDANGEIRFGPLPPGDYEVCRGDEPAGTRVTVTGARTDLRWP